MNSIDTYKEKTFEDIKHIDELGNEYWEARELMLALEYSKWEHFAKVINKAKYILTNILIDPALQVAYFKGKDRQDKFKEQEQYRPLPKQYVSGETFYIQGRALRLKVTQAARDKVYSDGVYLFLDVKEQQDIAKKERMVKRFLDKQCKAVFGEIVAELYPVFQKYGVAPPTLRIRNMDTRWGSCLPGKGIITLNKRLLEAPRNCIEYVILHELVHFIHPNHSRQFWDFVAMMMPDWKERKEELEKTIYI